MSRAFSPLISGTIPHHNKMHARGAFKPSKIIDHHWAGLVGGDSRLKNPGQMVSASYLIYSDGSIIGQVPETHRPWTSGGWEADKDAITIEIQNSGGQVNGNDNDPSSWPISAKAWASLILLHADIAQYYGWKDLLAPRIRGHREFQATACPGGYVWSRMDTIRTESTATMNGSKPAPAPKPTPAPAPSKDKSLEEMAREVLAGVHGNGHANRRKSLGVTDAVYQQVRAIVNGQAPAYVPAPKQPAQPAVNNIAKMASEVRAGKHGTGHAKRQRSLGVTNAVYQQVRDEVNRQIYGSSKVTATRHKTISQMATEVIAGKHGTGHANRQRSLGVDNATYQAVRAEVNRRV